MLSPFIPSFFIKSYTATSDGAFRVVDDPQIILGSCEVDVQTNPAYLGNSMEQTEAILTGAKKWFETPVRPFDLMFKNYTAGSNTKIVITGVILNTQYSGGNIHL